MKRTLVLLVGCAAACATANPADLVVTGNVVTMDDARPRARAVAIRKDRIMYVGDDASHLIGPNTKVIEGYTVVPGFIDAHGHLEWHGHYQQKVKLKGTKSFEEVLERVKARLATAKPGEWIIGNGWDESDWPTNTLPTHEALSALAPNNPVILYRDGSHASLINRYAMNLGGITKDSVDPEGGKIGRRDDGTLTGIFVDRASIPIEDEIPAPTKQERKEAILRAIDDAVRVGLTGVHDARGDYVTLEIYDELAKAKALKLRVYAMLGGYDAWFDDFFVRPATIGPYFTFRSFKLGADGALGSRGALLFDDYSDRPGHQGIPVRSQAQLEQISKLALERGFQVNVHAIGDRGNRIALDAFAAALAAHPTEDHRFRIEHAQILHPDDIRRFVALGVIPSMQPTHATSDMAWAEARVGPERIVGAYAWRSLIDSGAIIAGGSDFPIESMNPLVSIHAAVTRGGWTLTQRMTREEAMKSFTIWAAHAAFEEDDKGSIAVGKLADIVVLDRDVLDGEPSVLLEAKVEQTIVGGEIVY